MILIILMVILCNVTSTVFATVSGDGRVTVFDLSTDKYTPVCRSLSLSSCKNTFLVSSFIALHWSHPCEMQIKDHRQLVVSASKAILNTVVFNASEPIILVGDNKVKITIIDIVISISTTDQGTVHCLKLSPNLRRSLEEETNLEDKDEKLDVSIWLWW